MGQIRIQPTPIEGLLVIEPRLHGDDRGWFMEVYSQRDMQEAGIHTVFVQDNQSMSRKGVLRGLHYQVQHPQAKLVRVTCGCVFDVAVDLRAESRTFGHWSGVELTADNRLQFYIPEGFAHGFLVLSERAEFCYKCSDFYRPDDEGGLAWDDPDLAIQWPQLAGKGRDGIPRLADGTPLTLSDKDRRWPCLREMNRR